MDSKLTKPTLVAFELTGRCRLSCRYCRAAAGPGLDGQLDTNQCLRIISSIADYCRCTLILTGGEPMERPDLLELIKAGSDRGLNMVMATCGSSIDQMAADQLKQAGIKALAFSLDGPDPETHDLIRGTIGAFETVIKAASSARDIGLQFQINTTITRLNAKYVMEIAILARELGATCFNPFILVPTGRARNLLDQVLQPDAYELTLEALMRIPEEIGIDVRVTCGPQFVRVLSSKQQGPAKIHSHGCMGGIRFAFVNRKADVQACGFLDMVAGNLVENGYDFAAIWDHCKLFESLRDRAAITGHCSSCDFLYACGGCRARAYCVSGDWLASDPICKGPYRSKT